MDNTFFIFLDIDGTLWDNRNRTIPIYRSTELNPASIHAINYLAQQLQPHYDISIVVTSQHRYHWQHCQELLLLYGLNPTIPLYKLPLNIYRRENAIGLYLYKYKTTHQLDQPDATYHWSDYAFFHTINHYPNYVVIDDDATKQLTHIPASHRITTSYDQSLTKEHIDQYLHQFEWYKKNQKLNQLGNMLEILGNQKDLENKEKEVN